MRDLANTPAPAIEKPRSQWHDVWLQFWSDEEFGEGVCSAGVGS